MTMKLSDSELALFAELLDEVVGQEAHLLRDRIEAHLYLKGFYHEPELTRDEATGRWIARDGLYDGYGASPMEAIHELRRNMGK